MMSKSPFVSVIMPVYNCAQYLREAIESILNQTFQDFEFIIINDGSTDNTPEILREYANKDSRIRVINQPNSGIVTALNRGLKEAKGEWIFRMDGDDVALRHRFKTQIKTIENNTSLVLLGGWCQQVNSEGFPLKINKYPSEHAKLLNRLEMGLSFFPHSSACFHRDTVMKLGGYRERFLHAEDVDLWLRLSNVGEVSCYPGVIIKLRKYPDLTFEKVKLRSLIACAARICHYRRKCGFSDLSQAEELDWQKFLEWVEKKMEVYGFFECRQGWQALRNIWYANPKTNRIVRFKRSIDLLIRDLNVCKCLWTRLRPNNIALRLAEESTQIF